MFITFLFLIGLAVGSFANALAYRLVRGKEWVHSRSRCPHCDKVLQWHELVPIFSFLLQRGRCRDCGVRISWRYPLVELLAGLTFVLLWTRLSLMGASGAIFFVVFSFLAMLVLVLALYDLETKEVPLFLLGLLGVVGVLFQIWLSVGQIESVKFAGDLGLFLPDVGFILRVPIVFLIFSVFFGVVYAIYRKESFGFGDVLLFTVLALFFDLAEIFLIVMFSSLIGSGVGLGILAVSRLLRQQTDVRSGVPFVPFIFFGIVFTIVFGESVVAWYLGLLMN